MTRILLSPPDVGPAERDMLVAAFDSNWIAPLGPEVDAFEHEVSSLVGVRAGAALSSGTAALHLALVLLGVGPGDEVFVADSTFAASVNPVRYLGAQPVFIDSDAATWTMDPVLLEEALVDAEHRGRLPKAVITVDLYGQCADYDAIRSSCDKRGIPIVQDAAEALGAFYRGQPAGAQGDFAALSFNGNKIITTSGGGMLLSNDETAVARARFLASQARDPAPHYEHSVVGYNYRLSNLLAAVGRAQLRSLSRRVQVRRGHFEDYSAQLGSLPGWSFMPEASYGTGNRWLTCAVIDENAAGYGRDAVLAALAAANVEARPVWKPMHMQKVFQDCRAYGGAVSERLFRDGICLPSGSTLTQADRQRVIDVIRDTSLQVAS